MHSHLPIVLPTAFVGNLAIGFFAGDAVVVTTPVCDVHCVDVSAHRIDPALGTLLAERIRCITAVRPDFPIVVGVTRHELALAVDEELVNRKTLWHLGLHDSVFKRFPFQIKFHPATNDNALSGCSRIGCTSILGGES